MRTPTVTTEIYQAYHDEGLFSIDQGHIGQDTCVMTPTTAHSILYMRTTSTLKGDNL